MNQRLSSTCIYQSTLNATSTFMGWSGKSQNLGSQGRRPFVPRLLVNHKSTNTDADFNLPTPQRGTFKELLFYLSRWSHCSPRTRTKFLTSCRTARKLLPTCSSQTMLFGSFNHSRYSAPWVLLQTLVSVPYGRKTVVKKSANHSINWRSFPLLEMIY